MDEVRACRRRQLAYTVEQSRREEGAAQAEALRDAGTFLDEIEMLDWPVGIDEAGEDRLAMQCPQHLAAQRRETPGDESVGVDGSIAYDHCCDHLET